MSYKKGFSLISVLVAAIIIIIGMLCVITVIQNSERIFRRAIDFQDFAMAAEILNDKIQEQFCSPGQKIPERMEGKMSGFQNLYYEVHFQLLKDNLYEVHIKLSKTVEGKRYTEEFITALHQR